MRSKTLMFLLMLSPGLALLVLFNYLPMAGVIIAFKDYRVFGGDFISNLARSRWVGFENFVFLFKSPDAAIVTRNTILYNAVFLLLGNVASVFLAIALNELKNKKARKAYQSILLFPYFLSWIIMSYLFYAFLSSDKGIINMQILQSLGLKGVQWYSAEAAWPYILIFANLLKYGGYNSVIYLAAISGLDDQLFEAAMIDGCGRLKQITKITLPLLSPILIIMLLLGLGRIFNADFGLFFQLPMNSGALFDVTNVLDTYVYRALMQTYNIGMSSAAGLYQTVIGFVLVLGANLAVRRIDPDKALF